MSQWYYAHGGQQKGPVPLSELQRLADNGEFDPQNDLVWKEGMDDWKPGSTVPEVAAALSPTPPPPSAEPGSGAGPAPTGEVAPPAPAPEATPSPSPYTSPSTFGTPAPAAYGGAPAGMPATPPSTGMALGSMICGIVSLLGCCLWFLALPLAIVAVVLGHIAGSRIKSDPQRFGGKGLARTGLITGYLAILLTVAFLGFAFWLASLTPEEIRALDWIPPEQQEELIRELENAR